MIVPDRDALASLWLPPLARFLREKFWLVNRH